MVLFMIGLGLGDEDDITVKGLKLIQNADLVFLEAYTSVLDGQVNTERLEKAYNITKTRIVVADRDLVEQHAEERILEPARDTHVAFLVVGDPVCATTHTDLWLRARQLGIDVQTIHNASVMGAVGSCGLQLYNFGRTVSLPFFEEADGDKKSAPWKPVSFYPKIAYNRAGGMHTLCLLDIKVKEPDFQALMKGRSNVYLPPRYMTVSQAADQLIQAQQEIIRPATTDAAYDVSKTLCVGLARLGQSSQKIVAGTLLELRDYKDMGGPLHSLIITGGTLHDLELEFLKQFLIEGSTYELEDHEEADKDTTNKAN